VGCARFRLVTIETAPQVWAIIIECFIKKRDECEWRENVILVHMLSRRVVAHGQNRSTSQRTKSLTAIATSTVAGTCVPSSISINVFMTDLLPPILNLR
jgi:hypothetical protein